MNALIEVSTLVDTEVSIFVEDSNNEWYAVPLKEVVGYNDCYYLMIGKSTDEWCFLPDMLGRDFYVRGVRCTVEKLSDYVGHRFVVVEV